MKKQSMLLLAFTLALIFVLAFATSVGAGNQYQDSTLAHGKYIATIAGCTTCHTPYKADYQKPPQNLSPDQIQTLAFNAHEALDLDKLLAGNQAFDLGPAGIVFSRNITPDHETGIGGWTDDQIKTAIRTGQTPDGTILFPLMPYHVFNGMADADLDAVIAYLHSVQAIKSTTQKETVSVAGLQAIPNRSGIVAPDPSDKAARGAYLVNNVVTCTDCHTPVDPSTGAPQVDKYLAGGQPYEGPWGIVYGGNITPDKETGIGDWTEDQIKTALIAGVRKDGRRLILMPWDVYSALTPEDADAIAYYLKNVLPAVHNEVPTASLNQAFTKMAPQPQTQAVTTQSAALSPAILVVVGVAIILLVSLSVAFLRRKSA